MQRTILLILCLFACGCSAYNMTTNPVLTRLKNRGPLALSSGNPYVASNMMLQKTMDESSEVKGFVEHRGAPTVLEVTQDLFSNPSMMFYYPENAEFYRLENDRDFWLIEGPFKLNEKELEKLLHLTQVQLNTQDKLHELAPAASAKKDLNLEASRQRSLPEEMPPPAKKKSKMKAAPEIPLRTEATEFSLRNKESAELKSEDLVPLESPISTAPAAGKIVGSAKESNDSQIIQRIVGSDSQAVGELTPKGDLVHYVTSPDEDLTLIARWYTFDAKNTGRIARVSGISSKQPLSVGDTLIIPSYLLKNKVRLNKEGLAALKAGGK